jgi:hypothetical protein
MLRTDMRRTRWARLATILAVGFRRDRGDAGADADRRRRPPGTNYQGPAFTFSKSADGVYHAVGTGSLVVMSNAAIIGHEFARAMILARKSRSDRRDEEAARFDDRCRGEREAGVPESKRMHDARVRWRRRRRRSTSQAVNDPNIRTVGLTPPHGVRRAYELLDGKAN